MVYSFSPETSLEMLWYMRMGMSTDVRESARERGVLETGIPRQDDIPLHDTA